MPRIGVHLIYGRNPEPFLEAALRSVAWADYVCAVATDSGDVARANDDVVRRVVPRHKLRTALLQMREFSFSEARNAALRLADDGDYVLILDADDVHYPESEPQARALVDAGHDIASFHFYHLAVYKDLLHSIRYREVLFLKTPEVRFEQGVHERLIHPRRRPATTNRCLYAHYGYIKPAREVAARWEFYRSLGSAVHEYDVSQPDRALDAWPEICAPFPGAHPPDVRPLLESYPASS